MSSAILYLAIVAIWAGVLIPRWLKRDSSASGKTETEAEEATPLEGDADSVRRDERSDRRRSEPRPEPLRYEARTEIRYEARVEVRDEEVRPRYEAPRRDEALRRDESGRARRDEGPRRKEHPRRDERSAERAEAAAERDDEFESGRMELARDPEHRRVLSARRRLLTMLVVLVVASIALAVSKLAAVWVVAPPSVMLAAYVILLREAAKADAERARALGRAWREDERASAEAEAETATVEEPVAPPAPDQVAASTGAKIIDLPTERVGQEFYDQYADVKRRAVGDLSRLSRVGADEQNLGPAERDVRVEGEPLIWHESQPGVAAG